MFNRKTLFSKAIILLMMVCLIVPMTMGYKASASEKAPPQNPNFKLISSSANSEVFQMKVKGKWFEYRTTIKKGKNETVNVKEYEVKGKNKVYRTQSSQTITPEFKRNAVNIMATASACRGKNGYKRHSSIHRTLYVNSCNIKKFINITEDASSASGAIAGISAVIRAVAPYAGYIGAIAGVIWINMYVIKKVSKNGYYGVRFEVWGGSPAQFVLYPWRQ